MAGRSRNIYCRVVTPFDIEVAVGIRETNVWIGRSRSLANVYRTVRLSPGDELHLLFGGDFLIRAGQAYRFFMRRGEDGDILLHPGPIDPEVPVDLCQEMHAATVTKVASHHREFAVGAAPIEVPGP